jgi:hypothetical protein
LQDLQTSNLDLAVTGFDAKEIEDLQEWVEFVEVPGPPPSQPPADPWLPTCINVVFVEPYPSQLNAP